MNTPIADFVKKYAYDENVRFHMPGHKGNSFVGCETYDITEVKGADVLYEADGIIAESEKNAATLFGAARTVYSTEGSSQCIKAMLHLALTYKKRSGRPYVIAARNAHKAFLYAVALLDLDVVWLWPDEMNSICSCKITAGQIEEEINKRDEMPIAVYITSPDYLGGMLDIEKIAKVCHEYGTILAVDNAHGAYLRFLNSSIHPLDLAADICCDSAHKTLPVLTGGAYLHISKNAPDYFYENAKISMALFGSTSPSYLTLMSLDMCNAHLCDEYFGALQASVSNVKKIKDALRSNGWNVLETEPLKIVIQSPKVATGEGIANMLRRKQIECEYADKDYVVFMVSPENCYDELEYLIEALGENHIGPSEKKTLKIIKGEQEITVRKAMFSKQERIPVREAKGRICASPIVGCPPAIPIVVSGEVITEETIQLFLYYGIKDISVVI